MCEYGALLEWCWLRNTETLGEQPALLPVGMDCPWLNPGLRSERLATNRLTHDTVTQRHIPEERSHLIHHPEIPNVIYRLVLLNIWPTTPKTISNINGLQISNIFLVYTMKAYGVVDAHRLAFSLYWPSYSGSHWGHLPFFCDVEKFLRNMLNWKGHRLTGTNTPKIDIRSQAKDCVC